MQGGFGLESSQSWLKDEKNEIIFRSAPNHPQSVRRQTRPQNSWLPADSSRQNPRFLNLWWPKIQFIRSDPNPLHDRRRNNRWAAHYQKGVFGRFRGIKRKTVQEESWHQNRIPGRFLTGLEWLPQYRLLVIFAPHLLYKNINSIQWVHKDKIAH